VEPAYLYGRLYDMGVGYPALELPPESILTTGTADHLQDLHTQAEFTEKNKPWRQLHRPIGWGRVHGQVLTFNYPAPQFAGLDQLEGFNPGRRCLYQRVLTRAHWNGASAPVWVYVMENCRGARLIEGGIWE